MRCYIIMVGYIIYLLNLWFIPSGDTQQAGESELWSFAMSAPLAGAVVRQRCQRRKVCTEARGATEADRHVRLARNVHRHDMIIYINTQYYT